MSCSVFSFSSYILVLRFTLPVDCIVDSGKLLFGPLAKVHQNVFEELVVCILQTLDLFLELILIQDGVGVADTGQNIT